MMIIYLYYHSSNMNSPSVLPFILQDIISFDGWLSGSYVRDVLIRKDPTYFIKDIDVLIPFNIHQDLVNLLVSKYELEEIVVSYFFEEKIAHTHLYLDEIVFDIFSSEGYEYMSPVDFDVNTLCWTGLEYRIWYPVSDTDERDYGYFFDIDSIIERVHNKEAIAMIKEWAGDDLDDMIIRYNKMLLKGWTIINDDEVRELLG